MSTEKQHPNSKKVTIFRAGSFINDAQAAAKEYLSMSKRAISSYWATSSSKVVGSGLTFAEQDILLPLVLDVPKEDRQFRDKVRDFYRSIVTRIPFEKGLELEIGLDKDNNAPISDTNRPLNIMDYLRYKHALGHPRVALNINEAKGNQLKEYYIFDKEDAIAETSNIAKVKDEALVAYLRVKEDGEKVNMILTLLGVDPRQYKGKNAAELREQALREKADKDAIAFLKVYKTDNFEIRYKIQAMVNTGVIKKIGQAYTNNETGEILGHNLDEAIIFFKDTKNSNILQMLNVNLQEALRDLSKTTAKKQTAKAKAETTEEADADN